MVENLQMDLEEKRKIYVLCALSQDNINATYDFLDCEYERTVFNEEADFIIVDVDNLPKKFLLPRYLTNMTQKTFNCRPVIFVSLNGRTAGETPQLSSFNQANGFECTVCNSQEELENTLGWYSFMFRRPYWEKENLDKMAIMALMMSKNGETHG